MNLDSVCKEAASAAGQSRQDRIAVVIRNLDSGDSGAFNGDRPFYPASVSKLFFLAEAARQLDADMWSLTPEIDRAISDMIRKSSNDATGLIVDLLTQTTSGPELSDQELAEYIRARDIIAKSFASVGMLGLKLGCKTYWEGPYGREAQYAGPHRERRNSLTASATAELLVRLATGHWPNSDWAMAYLQRNNPQDARNRQDVQGTRYIGSTIPPGAKLWSKSGWTSEVRHDAALVQLASGARWVVVIFTEGKTKQLATLQAVAQNVARLLSWTA